MKDTILYAIDIHALGLENLNRFRSKARIESFYNLLILIGLLIHWIFRYTTFFFEDTLNYVDIKEIHGLWNI